MAKLFRRRGWPTVEPATEGPAPARDTPPVRVEAPPAVVRPARSASRAAWAGYANQLGYEVEDMTRAQIITALDAVEGP